MLLLLILMAALIIATVAPRFNLVDADTRILRMKSGLNEMV